jgi:hypothetical protein
MFASGVVPSHAFTHIIEFGTPVIGGLRVASGDLLFGDGNDPVRAAAARGAAAGVAQALEARDREVTQLCRSPKFSIEALRAGQEFPMKRSWLRAAIALTAVALAGAACRRRRRRRGHPTRRPWVARIARRRHRAVARRSPPSSGVPGKKSTPRSRASEVDLRGRRRPRAAGQLLAVLEVPELQEEIKQDAAAVKRANEEINRAQGDLARAESAHEVAHLGSTRLAGVLKARPNLVAQQDIDEGSAAIGRRKPKSRRRRRRSRPRASRWPSPARRRAGRRRCSTTHASRRRLPASSRIATPTPAR